VLISFRSYAGILTYLQMSVKTHERSNNCRGHTGRSVHPPNKWDSRTRKKQHKQDNRSAVRPRQADLVALVGAAMGILVGVVEGLVKSGSFFGPPLVGDNLPWDSWPDRHRHPLDARGRRAVRDHHAPGRRHLGSLLGLPPADPSCGCLRVHRNLDLDDVYTDRSNRRDSGDCAAVLDLQADQEEWLTVMFLRR
jgi:hypothetical protein